MRDYLPILTMIVLVLLFASLSFTGVEACSDRGVRRRRRKRRTSAASCPSTKLAERFPVKFYLVAMAFIVLDVEIIFLYPFTTVFRSSSPARTGSS